MKKLLTVLILSTLAFSTYAQSTNNIRLHILMRTGHLNGTPLKTTLNPEKSIRLKAEKYTLIEADADSLGLYIESIPEDNDKSFRVKQYERPLMLDVKRGQDYYFVINQSNFEPFIVNEVTKNAFLLNLAFGNKENATKNVYYLPLKEEKGKN